MQVSLVVQGINNDLSPDTKISETDVVFKERIEKEAITDEVVSEKYYF